MKFSAEVLYSMISPLHPIYLDSLILCDLMTLKMLGEEEICQLMKHILLQEQSSMKVGKIPGRLF